MDDQAVGDDGYSDDDLDALPVHAFHQLQQDAFRSTQQPRKPVQLPPLQSPQRPLTTNLAGGFGRLSVVGDVADYPYGGQQPSSDYGDFDDEMLDGEIFDGAEQAAFPTKYEGVHAAGPVDESIQREQWRQQRYGQPPSKTGYLSQQQACPGQANSNTYSQHGASTSGKNPTSDCQGQYLKPGALPTLESADVESLQAHVQKLLSERETLQRAIQDANDSAFAKAGEIAIVRANASKVEKEYENRTRALQKLHTDEATRQRIEVEKARSELQRIATEKEFLENDLAEGTKQIRNLQKTIKKGHDKAAESKTAGKENTLATPKKNKTVPYGDGFDGDEIQPLSPSKLVIRSKATTPKAGSKRKRRATDDSPVKSLELVQPVQTDSFEELVPGRNIAKSLGSVQLPRQHDQKFKLTQKFLNHRIEHDKERTFEALANVKFPSQPQKSLSTIILDKMSTLGVGIHVENLSSALGLIFISLWSQCIKEKFHKPIHLLIDLVKFVLLLSPLQAAPDLTNDLMELVQETADILIIPRCQKNPPRNDRGEISSTECLYVIHMVAQDCSIDIEEITRFWRTMRFDFIMMLLSFVHPVEEIHITIALLHTSVLDASFAMIIPPGDGKQDATEARVIDNLSRLLVEAPRPTQGEVPLDAIELSELRLEVLGLLDAMCGKDYGAQALAKHRLVIGRLVRVMNDELDRVYDFQYGHEQRIALVNASTRTLYHLTTNYAHLINMQARLSVIPGGEKKFLIALTRLAFSEGGFFEKGIEDDVVDCAHQMLEARVSPEEAEQLVDAFSSAPSTRRASKELS